MDQIVSSHPVFVLGGARSGTSAIAQSIRATEKYVGYKEGHLFDLLPKVQLLVERHYQSKTINRSMMIASVPQTYFIDGFGQLLRALANERFPEANWVDKTPSVAMVSSAPLVRNIWPNAKFIYMKRRGLENVASRMRKFPAKGFLNHCRNWSSAMSAWLEVRDEMGGVALELDQERLLNARSEAVSVLAKFLGLNEHETSAMERALGNRNIEKTSDKDVALSFEDVGWDDDQKAAFLDCCGPLMSIYGYSYDHTYYNEQAKEGAIRLI